MSLTARSIFSPPLTENARKVKGDLLTRSVLSLRVPTFTCHTMGESRSYWS